MGDPIALRHDSGPLDRDDVGAAGALALLLRRLVFGRVVVALRLLERERAQADARVGGERAGGGSENG